MSARHIAAGPLTREDRLAGLDALLRVSAELLTEVRRDLQDLHESAAHSAVRTVAEENDR